MKNILIFLWEHLEEEVGFISTFFVVMFNSDDTFSIVMFNSDAIILNEFDLTTKLYEHIIAVAMGSISVIIAYFIKHFLDKKLKKK